MISQFRIISSRASNTFKPILNQGIPINTPTHILLQSRFAWRGIPNSPTTKAIELFNKHPDSPHLHRHDPLITQAVNLLMRHGEKSKAQNLINKTFIELRNKSNRNPSDLFAKAVELAAPLVECTSFKRGSKVLQIPKALTERQKNRRGILWILEAAGKRSDKQFEKRLANEVLAVLDGSSGVIAKKQQIYKTALANRTNVSIKFNL